MYVCTIYVCRHEVAFTSEEKSCPMAPPRLCPTTSSRPPVFSIASLQTSDMKVTKVIVVVNGSGWLIDRHLLQRRRSLYA